VGLEYNPGIEELLPRATWFVSPEGPGHPSVALGFTADRLSTPEGHAVFLTFAKSIPGTGITPFASVKYATENRMIAFPFGASARLGEDLIVQALYDGNHTHLLLTRLEPGLTVNLILARMKHPGIGVSFGF
jgi:hypothetical protein